MERWISKQYQSHKDYKYYIGGDEIKILILIRPQILYIEMKREKKYKKQTNYDYGLDERKILDKYYDDHQYDGIKDYYKYEIISNYKKIKNRL